MIKYGNIPTIKTGSRLKQSLFLIFVFVLIHYNSFLSHSPTVSHLLILQAVFVINSWPLSIMLTY